MPRRWPIVHLLEIVGSRPSVDTAEIGLRSTMHKDVHPSSVTRMLTRCIEIGVIRHSKVKRGRNGRPRARFKLTTAGRDVLQLLGSTSERYWIRWDELAALARASKALRRVGSFKPKNRPSGPWWTMNRAFSA